MDHGRYVNPGNSGFAEILRSEYVDKTELIHLVNQSIGTVQKLNCISRPRRFGKSYAAKMLCAYYDCSCDSNELFQSLAIGKTEDYRRHLNQYNVICFDVTGFLSEAVQKGSGICGVVGRISEELKRDLISLFPYLDPEVSLSDCLLKCVEKENRPFVFIIDEWDAIIREAKDDLETQYAYLNLLRDWFKNISFTPRVVAAAYMTGILPIKKDGSQSAISDFEEYTMVKPGLFGKYVGFTEEEVKGLCRKHKVDFSDMKQWYDGYHFRTVPSVYNPNSVMKAIRNDDFDSYWTETSAAEGLMDYISRDYSGLTKAIAELIGGIEVKVSTTGFANDLTTFKGTDDVLTLLIHLGYLAYQEETKTVRIPNEEIRREFQKLIRVVPHEATMQRVKESDRLFLDTIQKNEEAVAAQIERIHREETSPQHDNREDSLRSVIKLAYYTYKDHYLQFEELAGGEGYADIVYLPLRDSEWPALIVELKWNHKAEGAIEQIRKKQYPDAIKDYGGRILLVGISYEKDAPAGERRHTCRIEEYMR